MKLPPVVSQQEWRQARDALLVKEKAHKRAQDELAAQRRRLPVTAVDGEYVFDGADGKASLLDLFDGRRQLVVYHFMPFHDGAPCSGCASFTDHIPTRTHLRQRDTNFVITTPTAWPEFAATRERLGWTVPAYSEAGNGFAADMGAGVFRAVLFFMVIEPAQVADVMEQCADRTQPEQTLIHDLCTACLHAAIHQSCHGQRHFQNMLDVVIVSFAGMVAGKFAAVQAADIGKHPQQL